MMSEIRPYRPQAKEIQQTARAIVQVLAEHGFYSCLFGSTAAAIYGAENRNPRVWHYYIHSLACTHTHTHTHSLSLSIHYISPHPHPSVMVESRLTY